MRRILKWFVPVAFFGGLVMLAIWMLQIYVGGIGIPRNMFLGNCTNSTLRFHLKVPKGNNYHFVLATPEVRQMSLGSPFTFSGRVRISSDASSVVDFLISSEQTQQCNWLGSAGIPFGLILTGHWNTNCPSLNRLIHAQGDYDIEIAFDTPPPPSTSVWLHWIQANKDKNR